MHVAMDRGPQSGIGTLAPGDGRRVHPREQRERGGKADEMHNRAGITATIFVLALAAYFIANGRHVEPTGDLPESAPTEITKGG